MIHRRNGDFTEERLTNASPGRVEEFFTDEQRFQLAVGRVEIMKVRKNTPLNAGALARIRNVLDDPVQTLEYDDCLFFGH